MPLWPFVIGCIIVVTASLAAVVVIWITCFKKNVEDEHRDTELLSTRDEWMIVRCMPQDGDSVFAAVAHQLFKSQVCSLQHKQHTAKMRERAVNQLRQHTGTYWNLLLKAVYDNSSRYEHCRNNEERVARYLDDLATPGFHGGEECLGALVDALLVAVWLYHEGGSTLTFRPPVPERLRVVRLAGRRVKHPDCVTRTHYDSVLATSALKRRG